MDFHPSRGKGYKSLSRLGNEPKYMAISQGESEATAVQRVINDLVNQEQIATQDIALLTPLSMIEGNSQWKPGQTKLGKFKLVHDVSTLPNEIFCSSIGAAKGLEYPVVILTELHSPAIPLEISNYAAHLHVGVSRARGHLIVMSSKEAFAEISHF